MAEATKFVPKGILLDVDGTLTNSRKEIPPKTLKVIEKFSKAGIFCGVSTSRHYAFIKNYILPHFPKNSLHVTSGGGQIVTPSGNVIWQKTINGNKVKSVIQEVERLGGAVIFGSNSKLYCSDIIYDNVKNHPWKVDARRFRKTDQYEVTLLSIVQVNPRVIKYVKSVKNIRAWLLRNSSGAQYYDIVAKGVNKLTGARIWCRQLGIGLKDVLAVGDNKNDYELISKVGFGVAMGDSTEKLKRVSKKIIGKVDNEALSRFLASLLVRGNAHR